MILLILTVILGLLPVVLSSLFIIIRDKEREPENPALRGGFNTLLIALRCITVFIYD